MSELLLVKAWRDWKRALIGLSVFLFTLLWPIIPLRSFEAWFKTLMISGFSLFSYLILSFLTACFFVLYLYNKQCGSCEFGSKGLSVSLFGALLGACPACIPFLSFFLPLSITITISYYSWVFLVLSITLLLFLIRKMNGFKQS